MKAGRVCLDFLLDIGWMLLMAAAFAVSMVLVCVLSVLVVVSLPLKLSLFVVMKAMKGIAEVIAFIERQCIC